MTQVHIVQQGETMISIAHRHGFFEWSRIWEHPENAPLRRCRVNPQVLLAGDRVFVPDIQPRTVSCAADKMHRFVFKRPPAYLRLHIHDDDGEPLVGYDYHLVVGERMFKGLTGDDGLIHHPVAPDAVLAELTVWLDDDQPHTWNLEIGHLDPVDTVAGVQARLNNLGYDAGEVTGLMNDETREALHEFQADHDIAATTDHVDEATRTALVTAHDRP